MNYRYQLTDLDRGVVVANGDTLTEIGVQVYDLLAAERVQVGGSQSADDGEAGDVVVTAGVSRFGTNWPALGQWPSDPQSPTVGLWPEPDWRDADGYFEAGGEG